LTAVLVVGWFRSNAQNGNVAIPLKSVPTFSTANIGRQGHFYVGGHYAGEPGKETMDGAMYVETVGTEGPPAPLSDRVCNWRRRARTYSLIQTPDGRPGWAYDFVNQGYTVYMMDYPGTGRSAYVPGVDGFGNASPLRTINGGGLVGWPSGRNSAEQLASG